MLRTVIIADDHPLFRLGLRQAVENLTAFRVVGEAADGLEALALAETLQPHIAILDIDMPRMNGIQVAIRLRQAQQSIQIVFLSYFMSETTLHQLKTIGAVGVLLKQSALPELESCLTQVVAGQSYTSALCYEAVGTSAGEVRAEPAPQKPPRLHLLTATERQVLRLIAQHKTTAEIAELLFNSVRTIEKHRANIGKKLGIEGNNSLLTFALTHRYWLE